MSEHCDSAAEIKTSIGGAQMKCPYCAEEVKDEAVVCKHCHRDLTSVRLNSLEIDVKKRLDELTDELQALKIRIASLESMLNSGLPLSQKTTDSPSFFWTSYPITLLIGIILPMACIGSFYVTYNAVMILLPFLIWTAIGSWPGLVLPLLPGDNSRPSSSGQRAIDRISLTASLAFKESAVCIPTTYGG